MFFFSFSKLKRVLKSKSSIITAAKGSLLAGPNGETSTQVTAAPITQGSNTDTTKTTRAMTTTEKSGSDPCANGDGLYPDVASGCKNYIQCVFSGKKG